MKIKKVSCDQFAGIRKRDVSFEDGINVIYGKNESGKSTLVNLISRTLFQRVRLDRRNEKDKAFIASYFPSSLKGGGPTGDCVDGSVTFETDTGSYKLTKEWGEDPSCKLFTPTDKIRDQGRIDSLLKDALLYGEGVYSDMLFSSQRNTDVSLQTILDASKKTDAKQEITNAVSQAFAESDGIPVDAIEQAIMAKIDKIAGKHWDFEREAPVRKAGRWSNDLGEILKAYYAWEKARDDLAEISRLEDEADRAANTYADRDVSVRAAEDAYTAFHTFAGRLAVQSERKKAINRLTAERQKIEEVLSKWPHLNENLAKAKVLQTEKANRRVWDMWNGVKAAQAELSADDAAVAALPYPDSAEMVTVKNLQREIQRLENRLCGMNVNAAIHMLGGNDVQIVSLRTGEKVDLAGGQASITEAVKITVPGVMEMQLSPADVDVASVEAQMAQAKETIASVFAQYTVKTLEELEAYAQKIDDAKLKINTVNTKIARVLGDVSMAQLEEQYKRVDSVSRSKEEIENDIFVVCGGVGLETFITKTETIVDGYAAEYGSVNDLKAKAFDLEADLKKATESVSGVEDIPAEYRDVTDPEAYLESLQNDLKRKQELREDALTHKTAAASKLELYKEEHPDACAETVENAERVFEETKSLLKHWLHIADVFEKQKESVDSNPMADIADNFARYLGMISGGRVSSEFPDADKLNMNIYSDSRLLRFDQLSEGTKETVSLAFRLAVLDHLFPDGGGVIVFDDPFTDMDAERMAQSCELIKECATRHQVIFLTCREEYLPLLQGHHVFF